MVPTTPVPNIIEIALALYFLNMINAPTKRMHSTGLKLESTISLPSALNKPNNKIDNPADAISATTAGLRDAKIFCTPEKLRYL